MCRGADPVLSAGEVKATRNTKMGYRVAVIGATGNVGREMLNILAERRFPASEVIALASSRPRASRPHARPR